MIHSEGALSAQSKPIGAGSHLLDRRIEIEKQDKGLSARHSRWKSPKGSSLESE